MIRRVIPSTPIVYCPDGYECTGDFMWVPKSGRQETGHIPGRSRLEIEPCGCPLLDMSVQPDGLFKLVARNEDGEDVASIGTYGAILTLENK